MSAHSTLDDVFILRTFWLSKFLIASALLNTEVKMSSLYVKINVRTSLLNLEPLILPIEIEFYYFPSLVVLHLTPSSRLTFMMSLI
ncbi:hypothetical protein EGR_03618 [Echinococcus granulosus]|uniref:Uncharacterized protein n=1 Tax=Echinococcus granulosus TaxID=6210 RepID=W6V5I2_ECHGR|nr:hypothetical protein EGR_03618 [Echinococcus granulosus]EUB61554.1 hypothetical protein EGR_03618 [Echinococcus granulosus]